VRADDVVQLQHGPAIDLDGEMVPIVLLGALFRLPPTHQVSARRIVLVIGSGAGQVAVIADAVKEEQELVFKELRGKLRNQPMFAGASILGSGEIVPILDVDGVLEVAQAPVVQLVATAERPPQTRAGHVLVVEDSLVAGELQKNILVAAGYETEIATDGLRALDMLLQKPWDLVVADVDMPNMNGLELTARMRADARHRENPVIIVTARDSDEDRRQGLEAGADAFIVKREFDQHQLLDRVRKLIARRQEPAHGHAR
jgi:two-component system chemotaxis sensor kinase CheA